MSEGEAFDPVQHRDNTITRKLMMICGEANGPPYDRTLDRLSRMLRKAPNGELPDEVRAFATQAIANLEAQAERYRNRRLKKHEEQHVEHIVAQHDAFSLMLDDLDAFLAEPEASDELAGTGEDD